MFSAVNHDEDYPPHLKHLAPSEADIDMVLEEASGKAVDKGTALANAQAMQERINQLEAERARLTINQAKLSPETFQQHLASFDADLITARERLIHFQTQLQNLN
jgi:hypothetical protein